MNGIQEVSGSIPLISTKKSSEIYRFRNFFYTFSVTLENSEKVVHNAYIIAWFLGCQNEGQKPRFLHDFLAFEKISYFIIRLPV